MKRMSLFLVPLFLLGCTGVSKDGIMKNCQAWGGDSGAPFFNWQNEIVGIHTKGNRDIGGLGHAGSKIDNETYDNVPIEKIKGL